MGNRRRHGVQLTARKRSGGSVHDRRPEMWPQGPSADLPPSCNKPVQGRPQRFEPQVNIFPCPDAKSFYNQAPRGQEWRSCPDCQLCQRGRGGIRVRSSPDHITTRPVTCFHLLFTQADPGLHRPGWLAVYEVENGAALRGWHLSAALCDSRRPAQP
jgi:hypothetical protein